MNVTALIHASTNGRDSNIERLTFAVFPVVGYSRLQTNVIRRPMDLATYVVRPQLARLPGVAIVGVAGGKESFTSRSIEAAAHNVSAQQVVEGIRNSNIIVSPGLIEKITTRVGFDKRRAKRPDELITLSSQR